MTTQVYSNPPSPSPPQTPIRTYTVITKDSEEENTSTKQGLSFTGTNKTFFVTFFC